VVECVMQCVMQCVSVWCSVCAVFDVMHCRILLYEFSVVVRVAVCVAVCECVLQRVWSV